MFAIGQSNFLQALGWAVLNSLWQMAFLWVVYQLVTAVFKVKKSSQKGNLATGLLFGGFAWFVFTFFSILYSCLPEYKFIGCQVSGYKGGSGRVAS